MFKKNNLRFGLLLGFLAPLISVVIYYFARFSQFSVSDVLKFMDYFGINSADDLPKLKEVFDDSLVNATPVTGELPTTESQVEIEEETEAEIDSSSIFVVSENGELIEEIAAHDEAPAEEQDQPANEADFADAVGTTELPEDEQLDSDETGEQESESDEEDPDDSTHDSKDDNDDDENNSQ